MSTEAQEPSIPRYPVFRDDVKVQSEIVEGETFYNLKSPQTSKFIRLREPEYVLLQQFDGSRTVEDAAEEFVRTFKKTITPDAVSGFVAQLSKMGFFAGIEAEKTRKNKSVLAIRLKTINPDRFLDWLYPKVKFLLSPGMIALQSLFIFFGAIVFFSNISHFPFNLVTILSAGDIIAIILSLFAIFVVHEFAHALVCKHFGGSVTEIGVLLLYFQPCVYCNLSDAYLFPEKRQRLLVMFAGVFFQLILWAAFTILWRITNEAYLLNRVFYLTAAVSFATLVFNFNPAIKLDGYYILADYLQIPNLRQKAFAFLWSKTKSGLFGCEPDFEAPTRREAKIYWRYGIASVLYSALLIGFVVYRGGELFISAWGGTGFVLFTIVALVIFNKLLRSAGARVAEVWRERKRIWMKPKRIIAYTVVIAVIVLLAVFVKIGQTAGGPAHLIAAESFVVSRIAPGLLETKYYKGGVLERNLSQIFHLSAYDYSVTRIEPEVAVGDTVAKGDTLLVINSMLNQGLLAEARSDLDKARADRRLLLSDPKVEEIATKKSEAKEAEAIYEKARKELNRTKELYNRELISEDEYEQASANFNVAYSAWMSRKNELELLKAGPKAEEIDKVDAEIEKLQSRVHYLEEQYEASVVKCPFDGILVGTSSKEDLLHLARTDSLIVEVKLNESDLDILNPASEMELRVSAFPAKPHYGEVLKLKLSPELTAVAAVENSDGRLLPEMTGYAKVDCGSTSLANLSLRKVMRFFRLEFWSWF